MLWNVLQGSLNTYQNGGFWAGFGQVLIKKKEKKSRRKIAESSLKTSPPWTECLKRSQENCHFQQGDASNFRWPSWKKRQRFREVAYWITNFHLLWCGKATVDNCLQWKIKYVSLCKVYWKKMQRLLHTIFQHFRWLFIFACLLLYTVIDASHHSAWNLKHPWTS